MKIFNFGDFFKLTYSLVINTKHHNASSSSSWNSSYGLRKSRNGPSLTNGVTEVEFEYKIEKVIVNNLNENVYVITNNETFIFDKDLNPAILNSRWKENECFDSMKYERRNLLIYHINYDNMTILECYNFTMTGIRCFVRNLTDLKCIKINHNSNDQKLLSISGTTSFQNNYIVKNNYLYFMPNIINLADLEYNQTHALFFFAFSLNPSNLFQRADILNREFEIEKEYVLHAKQSLNIIYSFTYGIYNHYVYVFNDKQNKWITKLLRFNDIDNSKKISSTELNLECGQDDQLTEAVSAHFNGVSLYVLFRSSKNNILCGITYSSLNAHFKKYIGECFYTDLYLRESVENEVSTCKNDFKNTNYSCSCPQNVSNLILPLHEFIKIKIPLKTYPVSYNMKLEEGENINKIHSAIIHDNIEIIFLITNKLNLYAFKISVLHKYYYYSSIQASYNSTEFFKISLTKNKFNPNDSVADMNFNNRSSSLYLSSSNMILLKINLADVCLTYSTCSECFSSNNPFCNWCLVSEQCTSVSNCASGILRSAFNSKSSCFYEITSISYDGLYYSFPIKYLNGQQRNYLSSMKNNTIEISTSFTFSLSSKDTLKCLLIDEMTKNAAEEVISEHTHDNNYGKRIICKFSSINSNEISSRLILIPILKIDHGSNKSTQLEFGKKFKFFYTNCRKFSRCNDCIKEETCKWDSDNFKCIDSNVKGSIKPECLSLNIVLSRYLSYNQPTYIEFELTNTAPYFDFVRLFSIDCQFNDSFKIGATKKNEDNDKVNYACLYTPKNDANIVHNRTKQFVYLNIIASKENNSYTINNLNEIKYTIFNCELVGNCRDCLGNYLVANCGWCRTNSICTTSHNCSSDFLDNLDSCPLEPFSMQENFTLNL